MDTYRKEVRFMKFDKECRVKITKKIYKKLKYVINKYGDTFFATIQKDRKDCILLLEPATNKLIEITSPKFTKIIGEYRKITIILETEKISILRYSYTTIILLYR